MTMFNACLAQIWSYSSYPQFSTTQQKAMSQFFNKVLSVNSNIENWNAIPACDGVWKRCMSHLIEDLRLHIECQSPTSNGAERAIEILKKTKDVKRFFCEHVIVKTREIPYRLSLFVQKMELNRLKRYTCVFPSSSHCMVSCHVFAENVLPVREKSEKNLSCHLQDREWELLYIDEIDIVLGAAFVKKSVLSKIKEKTIDGKFAATCEVSIFLPSHLGMKERIEGPLKGAFSNKVLEILDSEKKKQSFIRTTLTVACAVGMIYFFYSRREFLRRVIFS